MRRIVESRLLNRLLGGLAMVTLFAGLLTGFQMAATAQPAQAADAWAFQPGNIISDHVFFDGNKMDAGQVQSFLNSKVERCEPGYTCLKDYRQNTQNRPSDPMCRGYSGTSNESAATIIAKVGQSCGVSQQALIVLLQKEQGLITDDWPSSRQYRSATGYGCPDTADCDATYYGFFNQVYMGAWAMKRYTQPQGTGPGTEWNSRFDLSYPVGRTSSIQWNPNAGCGSSQVYIENQATHALYVYTPYRPNDAALRAGYGAGDGCSAYGNRNFFLYFSDWFGSPHGFTPKNAIGGRWNALGAEKSTIGIATGPELCGIRDNGCWQQFQNGRIYWSANTGAWPVTGAIQQRWIADGSEYGTIGFPTGPELCGIRDNGCWQQFQNGRIYWSANTGAWPVANAIANRWIANGSEYGTIGFPTGPELCGIRDNGCWQQFQNGRIYWSANTGAWPVTGAIQQRWIGTGSEYGTIGYPSGPELCGIRDNGCWQQFQNGRFYWSANAGAWPVANAIANRWIADGSEYGQLGFAVGPELCPIRDNGCWQQFQNGRIYWSASSGAWAVQGPIGDRWIADGSEYGPLGFPTSNVTDGPNGTTRQSFQRGTLTRQADGSIQS